jgi:hypothetical protein
MVLDHRWRRNNTEPRNQKVEMNFMKELSLKDQVVIHENVSKIQ